MKKFYKNHWPLFLIGAFMIYFLVLVYLVFNIELSTLQAVLLSAGGPSLIMLTIGNPNTFSTGWKTLFKPIIELYNHITKRGMCHINNVYFYPGTVFNEFTIKEGKAIIDGMISLHDHHYYELLHTKLFCIPIILNDFVNTKYEKCYMKNLNEFNRSELRDIYLFLTGYNEMRRVKEIKEFKFRGL
jgi:hypothetical protein